MKEPALKIVMEDFLKRRLRAESIDGLEKALSHKSGYLADYLAFDRSVVIELKSLNDSRATAAQKVLDRWRKDPDWPSISGELGIQELIKIHPRGKDLDRELFEKITESIEDFFEKANRQIRDTKKTFSIHDAFGVLLLLNDNVDVLDPRVLRQKLTSLMKRKAGNGSPRYPSIETVIIVSWAHYLVGDNGAPNLLIFSISAEALTPEQYEQSFEKFFEKEWSAFIQRPLIEVGGVKADQFQSLKVEGKQSPLVLDGNRLRKRVFVLGAGASLGSTLLDKPRPPLIRNLISTGRQIGADKDACSSSVLKFTWEELAALVDIPELRDPSSEISIERVYQLLDAAISSIPGLDPQLMKEGYQLLEYRNWLGRFVFITIQKTTRSLLNGIRCNHHDRIATLLRNGDTVISFNYDLVMDSSMRAKTPCWQGGRWPCGYAVPFDELILTNKIRRLDSYSPLPVSLLKPHGSINWRFNTGFEGKEINFGRGLSVNEEKKGKRRLLDLRPAMDPSSLKSYQTASANDYWDSRALWPSPTKLQSPEFVNARVVYEAVWNLANQKLAEADEITVIGFSMGDGDDHIKTLFSQSANLRGKRELKLSIVNPEQSVVTLFSGVFKCSASHYSSLEAFVREGL